MPTTDFSKALRTLTQACQQYLKHAERSSKFLSPQQHTQAQKIKQLYTICTPYLKQLEEDIDPTSFVNACLSWHKSIQTSLTKMASDHANVKVAVQPFKTDLSANQSTIPITQALYAEWVTVIETLAERGDTTTGQVLFEALRDHQGDAWLLTSDAGQLKAHYKANRRIYKKINTDMEGFKVALLPLVQ